MKSNHSIFLAKSNLRKKITHAFIRFFRGLEYFVGGKTRPVFLDIKDYPELAVLKENFHIIKQEAEAVLSGTSNIPKYYEIDAYQKNIGKDEENRVSGTSSSWRVFMLRCYGAIPENNQKACPITSALLNKIPYIGQAFFSVLEAGKSIPPHHGPYCGIIRYHLPLIVPSNNPPKLIIADQPYVWREGEEVLFDDTFIHSVQNNSNGKRVILFIDIIRQKPTAIVLLNKMFFSIISKRYGNAILKNLNWNQ